MQHFFITGASAGIGAALAKRLTASGKTVSAIARRGERLAALSASLDRFLGITCDVTDASNVERAASDARRQNGPIDVAILNAGIYTPQDGTSIDPAIYARHMDVNYMGVVNALAAIVPSMVAAGQGKIVIISSVAGWRGLPKSAAYGPTKAALISLAESLYFDLTPQGIEVQVICPGFVESEATAVNDFEMPGLMSAEDAASEIVRAIGQPAFLVHFPKSFTRKLAVLRWLPARWYFALVRKATGN